MIGRRIFNTDRRNIWAAFILIGLCVISYGNTLGNGFLLDDHVFLLGERTLGDAGIKTLFFEGFRTTYRPVVLSFLKLELAVFGSHPAGYHIVNIILFSAVCYVFFLILGKLTGDFLISLFCACLFAAHPINNFLVNYKTAGNLNLYVLLMQAAFLLFILYLDTKKRYLCAAGLCVYFLSLLAHEIAFLLPAYLFLVSFFLKKYDFRKSILLCLPYILPFSLFLFIRMHVVRANTLTGALRLDIPFEQYAGALSKLIWWYNTKIFVPRDILFIWDEPIAAQNLNAPMIAAIIIVLCVWAASIVRGRGSLKSFALNFYLIGFIPTALSSFAFTSWTQTAMIEPHWFVFPSIGIFLLFVLWLFEAQKIFKNKRVLFAIMTSAVLLLSLTTRAGNAVWKDDKTYCSYWQKHNALNWAADVCNARVFVREHDKGPDPQQYGDCREAADVAGAYHFLEENGKSLEYYLMALKMNPECVTAFYGLGSLYKDTGDYRMAEGAFRSVIAIYPNDPAAYGQLIEIYEKQGRADEAKEMERILSRYPE